LSPSRGWPRSSAPPPPSCDFDDDFDFTILQMQRESIAAQEEQAREAGRAIRREEVEQLKEQDSTEREEYFQSVMEASQAALRAPRGAYYRKPGESSQESPTNAQSVEVGGVAYLYDQGVFWMLPGPPFIVVVAPYGAVVDTIPAGAYRVPGKGATRHYYFGTFFEEKSGKFEVIKPPPGTLVSYLPDGYRQEQVQGKTYTLRLRRTSGRSSSRACSSTRWWSADGRSPRVLASPLACRGSHGSAGAARFASGPSSVRPAGPASFSLEPPRAVARPRSWLLLSLGSKYKLSELTWD
jgi:hypothetical protein